MKRARQMEGRAANLKRRIATMNHLIPECDRIVGTGGPFRPLGYPKHHKLECVQFGAVAE
jgi:hypothetical protein